MENLSISTQNMSNVAFAKPQHKATEPPVENHQPQEPAPEQLGGPKEMCGRSQVAFSGRLTGLPTEDLNFIASKLRNHLTEFSKEELSAFKRGLTEVLNENNCRSLRQLFAQTDESDMKLAKTYLSFADTVAKNGEKAESQDIQALNGLLERAKKDYGCEDIHEMANKAITNEEDAFGEVANYMPGDKFSTAFNDLFIYLR